MSLLKWGENASRGCRGVFHRGTASAALEGPGLIVSADLSLPLERWRDHLIVWLSAVRSVTPALKNSNELINWQLLCFYPRLGLHSQHLSAARRQRCIVSSSLEMQVKQQTLHQLAALYLKTLRKKKSRTNLADWLVACSCKFSSSLILFFLCLFYPHKVCETHFSFLTHSCPVPPPRSASRSSLPCETLNKNCYYIVSWHFYGSVVIWQQRQGDKSLTTHEQLRESRRLNVGFNWLFVFELSSCGLGWSWRWRKTVISLYLPWSINHLGAEDALILILLITRNRSVRRARWNHLRH